MTTVLEDVAATVKLFDESPLDDPCVVMGPKMVEAFGIDPHNTPHATWHDDMQTWSFYPYRSPYKLKR